MRPIDADYILSALGVFSSEEPESANFMHGIKTAREIVEDAPTVGGWIRVEDRLPDPPCYCLIYTPEKGYGCDGVMAATYTDYGWMTPVYYPDPTHWRPMPEKPEEVVEDADGA